MPMPTPSALQAREREKKQAKSSAWAAVEMLQRAVGKDGLGSLPADLAYTLGVVFEAYALPPPPQQQQQQQQQLGAAPAAPPLRSPPPQQPPQQLLAAPAAPPLRSPQRQQQQQAGGPAAAVLAAAGPLPAPQELPPLEPAATGRPPLPKKFKAGQPSVAAFFKKAM